MDFNTEYKKLRKIEQDIFDEAWDEITGSVEFIEKVKLKIVEITDAKNKDVFKNKI